MSDLRIDRATSADAEHVVALLDAASAWQSDRGIDLWKPGRFGPDVRQTIANGDLYVARRDGELVGCFMLDDGSPRLSRWLSEHGREPTRGVIGRLAVAREVAGRGLGLELLRGAEQLASTRGIAFVTVECPSENDGLRRYYLSAGFTYCGDNHTPGPPRGTVGLERVRAPDRRQRVVKEDACRSLRCSTCAKRTTCRRSSR